MGCILRARAQQKEETHCQTLPAAASPSGNESHRRFDATSRALALFTAFCVMLNTFPLYTAHHPFARELPYIFVRFTVCEYLSIALRSCLSFLRMDFAHERHFSLDRSVYTICIYIVGWRSELIYSSYAATEAINTFHAQVSTTLSTESAGFPGDTRRMKAGAARRMS